MKNKSKKLLAILLAMFMVINIVPFNVFAKDDDFDDDFKVVVSMEGLTLGQGLYFEPKAYTLDEINDLVASEEYGPYTKDDLTAGIATLAFLIDNHVEYNITGSWDSNAYLAGVKGIDKKTLNIPAVITDNGGPSNSSNDGNDDDYLGQMDYGSMSGWMITVNDFMTDEGCAAWVLSKKENKAKCPSDLGNTYVVRWQFSLYGYGADLGVDTGWGTPPYFTAANKAALYAAYAESDDAAKKAAALPIMEKLTATQDEVNAALASLTSSATNEKTVTVKIAPNTVNALFYSGDNANTQLSDLQVTDKGKQGNYHEYVLSVPAGDYSYRATDSETDLGGMSFTVGDDVEQSMTLVRTNYYTTNNSIAAVGDYDIEIMPGSMRNVVNGHQYIDTNGYVVTPTLLWANGNAMLYNWKITLNGEPAQNYGVAMSINNTFANTLSAVQNKTFTLANLASYEIIAPKAAEVKMFNQLKNFNVEEIPQTSQDNADNGNIKHVFRTVESANLTYRVSMNGKITRAGYMGATEKTTPVAISFGENENPKTIENIMDSATMQSRIESSTFVNVNRQNDLAINVNDTFRLRAYRGAWEIINSDTANIMIEPDFHYNVISGGEHISMTPASNRCTGNAKDNWMDIKGVSAGTAIVEVSYDAIIIGGSGTSYTGQYGATDPNRKSLVVIQVGEENGILDMKAKDRTSAWDTELDTVYTVEETASLSFTAKLDDKVPVVSLSTDKGNTWKNVSKNGDYFEAEGLVPGNNIFKFTANGKTVYQVVRAAKIAYTVRNLSRNAARIMPGDKLEVTFYGTYMAIPKMSGIYNPSAHTLVYGNTQSAKQQCGGYDLPSKCVITLTIGNESGEQVFEDGYISSTMWCANDPMGAHRTLSDAGVGANFDAPSLTFNCGVYPILKFNVAEKAECEHKWSEIGEVTVKHKATKAGEMRYTCEKCGEYRIVPTTKGQCAKFAVEVAAVEPTVTKDGHTAGTWCSQCHERLSGMETIPAKGYKEELSSTLEQLAETVSEPAFGTNAGEWSVLTLARGEYYQTGNRYFEDYYSRITETVVLNAKSVNLFGALDTTKSTENSRLIMALAAIGKDPTNVGGVNVLGAYDANGFNWIKKQGINGPIFTLIALDTNNYQTKDTTIRKQCIDFILDKELEDGGWAYSGNTADPDMTSMALQALAKYKDRLNVPAAVDKAIAALSDIQEENGGFASWGSVNSESIAQVIVACTAWGIDPDTDARFIKNGKSAVDALLDFYVEEDKGFAHKLTGGVDAMATDQAAYALVAYDRFKNGKTSLYDMSDVSITYSYSDSVEILPTVVDDKTIITIPESIKIEDNNPLTFIAVSDSDEEINSMEMTIPKNIISQISRASKLELQTNVGTITFDKNALGQLSAGDSSVSISMSVSDQDKDGNVTFSLTAKDEDGEDAFIDGGAGSAVISADFEAPEEGKQINVYYNNAGKLERVFAQYENGKLSFIVYHFSEYIAKIEDSVAEARITLPENVYNATGSAFNAIINLSDFPKDYRLLDCIIYIPEGVTVSAISMGSCIDGGEVQWNLEEVEEGPGKLRVVYSDLDSGQKITASADSYPLELMTIRLKLTDKLNQEDLTVQISGMTFKKTSDNSGQMVIDTDFASASAKLVDGVSYSVSTLYTGDDIDLISASQTAIAVAVTGIEKKTKIEFKPDPDAGKNINLKYNDAITEKTGIVTYLAIVDDLIIDNSNKEGIKLEDFIDENNYKLDEDKEADEIVFGDINNDGDINAQDALGIVNFWLRKSAPNNDEILASNVNADSRINTFDALGIVENFVDNSEFGIVGFAAQSF